MTKEDAIREADELQAALDAEREAHFETEAALERERERSAAWEAEAMAARDLLRVSIWINPEVTSDEHKQWRALNACWKQARALNEPAPDPAADAAERLMDDFDRALDSLKGRTRGGREPEPLGTPPHASESLKTARAAGKSIDQEKA